MANFQEINSENTRRPAKILVAEDNVFNQDAIGAILEMKEYRFVIAENGKKALEVLQTEPCDLILMDLQMPEMDGIEATARIRGMERETGAHIPIIALTGSHLPGGQDQCRTVGMDAYIAKPFDITELYQTIDQLLNAHPR